MKSRPFDGWMFRRRPRLWRAVIGLVAVVVVFVALAWPHGGGSDRSGLLNAIAKAAEVTQREPGGHAAMHAIVSLPTGSKSLTITATMVFENTGRSRGILTMPNPRSGDMVEMQMVGDGAVLYMRSSLFGSLPEGRKWMKLDFSSAQEPATPLPGNGDATQGLKILEAAAGVRKLGKAEVRGVAATRYRGTIGGSEDAEPLRVEAWIDANGRVRRMRLVNSQPQGKSGSTTMDMRIDFFDFGNVPKIGVPAPSEVFDATALAKSGSNAG